MNSRLALTLFALTLAFPSTADDSKSRWLSYADAQALAQQTGKPIFLVFR